MKDSYMIAVVDDTPANLRLLENILNEAGYKTRVFLDGNTALKSFEIQKPDLVVLDIRMPNISGYEVAQRVRSIDGMKDVPVIFISSLSDVEDKIRAFQTGAVDYITKPFQVAEVLMRVQTHLKMQVMKKDLEKYSHHLEDLVEAQVADTVRVKDELAQAQSAIILALSKISEARDEDTGKHIDRTRAYCLSICNVLRNKTGYEDVVTNSFIESLSAAAPLHDIGKVGIPDAILLKKGKLTDEEFEVIKTHTLIGSKNLETVLDQYPNNKFVKMGVEIARYHHEKWDGTGYPEGLKGDEIPLSAQIMAVADVYDALRSERSYKPEFSHPKSRDIILNDVGTHFAPVLGEVFEAVEEKLYKISLELAD